MLLLNGQARLNTGPDGDPLDLQHYQRIMAMRDPATCRAAIQELLENLPQLSPEEAQQRTNASFLVCSNQEKDKINKIQVRNFAQKGHKALFTWNNGHGSTTTVCHGAPMMILRSSRKTGLCNGELGTLAGLVYDDAATATKYDIAAKEPKTNCLLKRPDKLLVRLRALGDKAERDVLVPNHDDHVVLAFAFTVHKIQGVTLEDDVVLVLDQRPRKLGALDFHGLYVAISRCRHFSNLHCIARGAGDVLLQKKLVDPWEYLRRMTPPQGLLAFIEQMKLKGGAGKRVRE
jgi:ATP-dependent exoDNAse (exonuclease V) alpha subunit